MRLNLTPLKIIILYVSAGGLWMWLSDKLLFAMVSNPTNRVHLEALVNWGYIIVTAGILYVLIRRDFIAIHMAMEAAQESEARFRQLAENVQEAFWMTDAAQGHFLYISPVYEEMWGRSREELYMHPDAWIKSVHTQDRARVISLWEQRMRGGYNAVYRIRHPDGSIHWIEDRAFPIQDTSGQVYRIGGVLRDITEQVLAREKLEQRVEARTHEIERRRKVAEGLRDTLNALNSALSLEQVLDMIAMRSGQLLGISGAAIFRQHYVGEPLEVQAAYGVLKNTEVKMLGNGTPFPGGQDVLLEAMTQRCPVISGAVLAVPLLVKGEIYGGLMLCYPTPRQIAEEEIELVTILADQVALAIENARLRAEVQQAAVLAERSRLARDLHDSVTQALYSIMLYAEATNLAMAAGKQAVATKNLLELRNMAHEAMLDMRVLIFELHPPVLEEEGLVAALQARLAAVEARAGLRAEVEVEGERRLPLRIEEELFWIAQEALNNAAKHSKAEIVTVRLHFDEQSVRLTVQDNGKGFDTVQARQGGGMGMRGIEERVQRIHGKLEIISSQEVGTTLSVVVDM
ncbi:MAG: PAS domain-containing protein [Anaerolineae bacterium]|nr:PAS domain-containing protein [Anaerolineae bacterium]